jgi:murein DD-endopeptidase / murein LD-carboxypeptidase
MDVTGKAPRYPGALEIPDDFLTVRYNGAAHPAAPFMGLASGANCQRFVFELLRHFGYEVAPLRSSDLWEDRIYTRSVRRKRPLNILMFNRRKEAWGAHLALYVGRGHAIHLCKAIGAPAVWRMAQFQRTDAYQVLVGIKRPIGRRSLIRTRGGIQNRQR